MTTETKKPKSDTRYVVRTGHDQGALEDHPDVEIFDNYEDAVDMAHKFFLGYDFEIRDGKPFDAGNDDGKQGGFECFEGVVMYAGKVAEFSHCGGDGPVCCIDIKN